MLLCRRERVTRCGVLSTRNPAAFESLLSYFHVVMLSSRHVVMEMRGLCCMLPRQTRGAYLMKYHTMVDSHRTQNIVYPLGRHVLLETKASL